LKQNDMDMFNTLWNVLCWLRIGVLPGSVYLEPYSNRHVLARQSITVTCQTSYTRSEHITSIINQIGGISTSKQSNISRNYQGHRLH